MVVLVEILFWMGLLLLLYVYGGYALLTLPFTRKKAIINERLRPHCTLLIAAYNEEKVIADKIRNSLELDYPGELLDIVIVTDGSTDKTNEIASQYPVKLFYQPERQGKLAAIQRILPAIRSEIVVFTDANCMLNKTALTSIVPHFSNPDVGAVSGEKKVRKIQTEAATEGIYWQFESWLKKKDSAFYSIVGAAGELLAIRTKLYTILNEHLVLDDFIQSMLVCNMGYRVVYEPSAFAAELPSPTLKDEFSRKVRIAAGGFQAIDFLSKKMNFRKYKKLAFLYISHRVLRWTLAPFYFFTLLPLNIIILLLRPSPIYGIALGVQLICYLLVIVVSNFPTISRQAKIISLVHYFFLMQIGVVVGKFRYLKNGQTAIWEKIPRI